MVGAAKPSSRWENRLSRSTQNTAERLGSSTSIPAHTRASGLISISYPDWETYGKATQALANDAEHTELRGQMMGISHMDDRTILVGHDV